jgi:serine phosphatase RsbU (regulator of sigma subunit)
MTDGRVAAYILDVAGKGIAASLLKAWVAAALRVHLVYESDPVALVCKLNTFVCERDRDRFVTLAVLVLDPSTHTLTVVNAGHLPPLLFRHHHGISHAAPDHMAGLPLGVMEKGEYHSYQMSLEPGEIVMLITDGVPDAQAPKGDHLGVGRIAGLVDKGYPYSPGGLGRKVVSAVGEHMAGAPQFDDITLVCFGRIVCPTQRVTGGIIATGITI